MLFNLLWMLSYGNTVDVGISRSGLQQAQQDIDRCTFSRTILSQQRENLTFAHFQVQGFQRSIFIVFFMEINGL
ncbi:hypothetical protein D3C85_1211490 [compost metagenome]